MPQLRGKQLLIVDDEPLILDTLREQFEIHDMIVTTATNGREAFELIQKAQFDLVISDIRMPECSGLDLLELVRSYNKKVPDIILISAFDDVSLERAKALGAKGLFLKPTIMKNVLELVKESFSI